MLIARLYLVYDIPHLSKEKTDQKTIDIENRFQYIAWIPNQNARGEIELSTGLDQLQGPK